MPSFAGYQDLRVLAEGRDRVIYSALRSSDQLPVVLKALRSEYPSEEMIALMYHEYDIAKNLDLPGIIKTYEFIDQKNQYALVQENINGTSLHHYLQEQPLTDLSFFFKLAIKMTKIVGELHQHNVIHKDIKPSNFIIEPESLTIKLSDFNFSSRLQHEVQDLVPPETLEGTLAYMAPEQTGRMNMNIDYRSDFYALGVSFYEMLTGELPFLYSDPLELLHAHIANPVPDLNNIAMPIPPVLTEIVKKLMAKNPSDRYQSAIGIEADLKRAQKQFEETGKIETFLLGVNDVSDRLNLSQKLYGRLEKAKELLEAYERVSKGGVEALMVCGYSGIGKTMLINEVHKPMVKDKGYFIGGKFDQLARNTPYTAITQAINQLARLILAEPETRFETIKREIISALGGVAQVIIDIAPDIQRIIGPQPPLEKLPPQETQNRMMIFFQRFLHVIASQDHPLVLFIDDLQWADSGSLNLLQHIMADGDLRHLLLIGAYRDNEVDEHHILRRFFKETQEHGKEIHFLPLGPLTTHDFEEFFSDSFHLEISKVRPLAEFLHKRTEGNPFFCKQIIQSLYKEKLLYFDLGAMEWAWNFEGIVNLKITDNVVDLMLSKLATLPAETQAFLKYAACIGNQFSLEMLSVISGEPLATVGSALWPALQQELIISFNLGYKRIEAMSQANLAPHLSKDITFHFIHDRVQQAAYEGIPQEERERTHLKIARLLIEKDPEACKKERLFEVVDHFNQATALLQESEKSIVMQLNYQAGLQARYSNAYEPMMNYLSAALHLISQETWDSEYDLAFSINCEYCWSLFLLNKVDETMILTNELLIQAKNNLDRVKLYRIQSKIYHSQGNLDAVYDTTMRAFNDLGVKLPKNPNKFHIFFKLIRVKWEMRRFHLKTLDKELAVLTDPSITAVFDILMEVNNPLATKGINVTVFLIALEMELLLRYGRSENNGAYFIGLFAILVRYLSRDINRSFQYWDAAVRLLNETPNKNNRGLTNMAYAYVGSHFRFPFKVGEEYALRSIEDFTESGNRLSVASAKSTLLLNIRAQGKTLKEIENATKIVLKAYQENGIKDSIERFQLSLILSGNAFLGREEQTDLMKSLEEKIVREHSLVTRQFVFRELGTYYYFMGFPEETLRYADLWLRSGRALVYDPLINQERTIYALAMADAIPRVSRFMRRRYRKNFQWIKSELKWIVQGAPENYLHLYYCLEGVEQNLNGNLSGALLNFNKAIEKAKANDFFLWTALINELAGNYLIDQSQPRCAVDYFREAYYYYSRYGHTFRMRALQARYPNLFEEKRGSARDSLRVDDTFHASTATSSAALDFMSVIKASQTISGEIILDKLFEKMLRILVENAGAEKALFLEQEKNTWMVTASLSQQKNQDKFEMLNLPLKDFENIPHTMIQFACRSEETVVLSNAAENEQYRQDPYIMRVQPKSVLCLPVLHQDKVLGIIYLENNLTVGAFTQLRVTVLTTLASQIAISLENSHYLAHMQRLFEKTERFVPKKFLEIINKENLEEVSLGDCAKRNITVLFNDIRSFTTLVENRSPEDAFAFINRYWKFMAPIIRKHGGYIDQYQGDAILAIFPGKPEDCVRASVAMMKALGGFNKFQAENNDVAIGMGIGISTGPAMLGVIGEEERQVSGLISDVANTASRVEGLNKAYGSRILMSDATEKVLPPGLEILRRRVDRVKLKGKMMITEIFEVIEWGSDSLSTSIPDYLSRFAEAFEVYQKGDFQQAAQLFGACLDFYPDDKAAALLRERCQVFQASPPVNWDGAFTLTTK